MSDFDKTVYWINSAEYDSQTTYAMLETRRLLCAIGPSKKR